jgi:hypothetical protein
MQLKTLLVGVAALFALPTTALAATPPTVTGPTPESLLTKPSFSWTNGPAGEVVSSISIGPKADVLADGSLASTSDGGTFLYPLEALTSTTTERPLYAGTWYWTAGWKTPDGAPTYERGNTPVQSFVVPPYLRTLRGTFIQYSSIPAFSAKGSFSANVRAVSVTCTIYNGRARVSSQRKFTQPYFGSPRTNFYCSDLKVPERLDRKRLRLVVVARGGGRSQTAVKWFRAT